MIASGLLCRFSIWPGGVLVFPRNVYLTTAFALAGDLLYCVCGAAWSWVQNHHFLLSPVYPPLPAPFIPLLISSTMQCFRLSSLDPSLSSLLYACTPCHADKSLEPLAELLDYPAKQNSEPSSRDHRLFVAMQ